MDASLYAYIILVVVYRISESAVVLKTGSYKNLFKRKWKKDWTTALVIILFVPVIVGPPVEYLRFGRQPGYISWTLGAIFFLAAAIVRAKGHLDLGKGFTMFIEKIDGQQLVDTGLYKHIRHPLYLAILFLFLACPLFLASRISWIFTALGLVALYVRIKVEERFLLKSMEGYREYMSKTWALIPWVY